MKKNKKDRNVIGSMVSLHDVRFLIKKMKMSKGEIRERFSEFPKLYSELVSMKGRDFDPWYLRYIFSQCLRATGPLTNAQKSKRKRENKKISSALSFESSTGKNVTAKSYYRNEFVHYLICGKGRKLLRKMPLMSQDMASRMVARWLFLLGFEKSAPAEGVDVEAFEEKNIKRIAANLSRSYRQWHIRELPNCPRGQWHSSKSKKLGRKNPLEFQK